VAYGLLVIIGTLEEAFVVKYYDFVKILEKKAHL
jgi:hypothetical protein